MKMIELYDELFEPSPFLSIRLHEFGLYNEIKEQFYAQMMGWA